MRVLICPDKFKGCLSAAEVAETIAWGFARSLPEASLTLLPLADGGEGTAEILREATGGKAMAAEVSDPLGRPVMACFAALGDGRTAVLEMAAASGLALLEPGELDPLRASTYGTGELIRAALDRGFRQFIMAVGGSATNDGGMGMAVALGARFLDAAGKELYPCGASLGEVASVDLSGMDRRLEGCEVVVACDVANPLLGPEGATMVYGPQKGAGREALSRLEEGMRSYAAAVRKATGKDLASSPGSGAAGGLAFGLMAFLGARAEPGIEVVMRAVGFREKARACDLIITGEGRYDAQTAYGKTVSGVSRTAFELGKPLFVLAGALADEVLEAGEDAAGGGAEATPRACVISTTPRPMDLEEALASARRNLRHASAQLARAISIASGSLP